MNVKLSGRCLCGKISYSCTTDAEFSFFCQCRQCQRITGTGHSAQFAVLIASTVFEGTVQTYELQADSGNKVISAFCGTCGSPIYKTTSGMPDMLAFHAATLDDPSLFKPRMLLNSGTAQPWDFIHPAIDRSD